MTNSEEVLLNSGLVFITSRLTLCGLPPRLAAVLSFYLQRVYSDVNQQESATGSEFMTKKDIVRTISEEVGLTQQQTKLIVQKTFDAIVESLVRERRIELRNFGVFEVKPRAARKARNPRTGEEVVVPRKHVVTFKPGKTMEARVRDLDEIEEVSENDQANSDPKQSDEGPNDHSGRWDTE